MGSKPNDSLSRPVADRFAMQGALFGRGLDRDEFDDQCCASR
jgi:hypothetical protein